MSRTQGQKQRKENKPRVEASRPAPKLPTVDDQNTGKIGKIVAWSAGGLVVLAGLIAFGITLAGEDSSPRQPFPEPEVTVTGSPLGTYEPAVVPDPEVGRPAPEVFTVNMGGEPAELTHDGTPKLVLFLAHWCEYCQREVPLVQNMLNNIGGVPEGVDFVSVVTSIDKIRPNWPPDRWLEREGWTQRVLVDDEQNSIGNAYGVVAYPYYVTIDTEGNVTSRATGNQSISDIETILHQLAETAQP